MAPCVRFHGPSTAASRSRSPRRKPCAIAGNVGAPRVGEGGPADGVAAADEVAAVPLAHVLAEGEVDAAEGRGRFPATRIAAAISPTATAPTTAIAAPS